MKIERINDNQIRCTLTREDLDLHQIQLSELAYGTEKARSLFRDMMQQAHKELGFEADNIPLMIEAIPMSGDGIVLIITKVEDPEELDTRFSKFAPRSSSAEDTVQFDGADSIIDIFQKIYDAKVKNSSSKTSTKPSPQNAPSEEPVVNLVRLFTFHNLDEVIQAARGLNNYFTGVNTLYKDSRSNDYLLVVHQSSYTPEEFNKVCNILSEYGKSKAFSHAGEAHLLEHQEVIVSRKALQKLSKL